MSTQNLDDGKTFHLRQTMLWTAIGVPGAVLCVVYLATILTLTSEQWWAFGEGVGLVAVGLAILSQVTQRRHMRPVLKAITADSKGELHQEDLEVAFARIARLPYRSVRDTIINWSLAAGFVPLYMWFALEAVSPFTCMVVASAALSAGTVASVFTFFSTKRLVTHWVDRWAQRQPDVVRRAELMPKVSLSAKLFAPTVAVSMVTLLFGLMLSYASAGRPVEAQDLRVKQAYLGWAVGELASDSEALPHLREMGVAFFVAQSLLIIDREAGGIIEGPRDGLDPGELHWLLGAGAAARGESKRFDSSHSFAWQDLDAEGRLILVATTPGSALTAGQRSVQIEFAVLMAVALALMLLTCRALAGDICTTTDRLIARAERVASGDFRKHEVVESEDELGALGRAFDRMVDSLKEMIGRVASAADGLDRAVSDLGSIGEAVAVVTDDQRADIEQATVQVAAVNQKVSEITESAQALNANVEEASSSILELGAASEQLNQTATTLSSHVEEVGGSIEQMIRSVAQVGENTDDLAQGVAETASSMAEMAMAMSEVDSTATKTAQLSAQVVEFSESGQERVHETISGMEAIRDATETADRVIGSLADRMAEIGAIVDVIDDVADETNLLALNAAIIAAQAGEQGRSFSVVADEIKDLADRVLTSTKEIGALILSVQSETSNATEAIGFGTERVLSGVGLAAEAGVALEKITGSARDSGERIEEIVNAVREQASAARHVAGLMERVNVQVEEIRQAGQEQERGNEVLARGANVTRDVAQQTQRTTEEQSRGAGRIRHSMESIRDAVDQIHAGLQEQTNSCRATVSLLEKVFERTQSNEDSSRRLDIATRELSEQAASLRNEVQRFRIQ